MSVPTGPWEATFSDTPYAEIGESWMVDDSDGSICTLDGPKEDRKAAACLIAAAPELLEALRTKRDYVADAASGSLTYADSGDGFIAMAKEDLARIDAAIAKATGAGA